MFEDQIKYLKDNPNRYWFKRKLYGWGWVPATWAGWAVLAVFLAYILYIAFSLDGNENPTSSQVTRFLVKEAVAVVILLLICFKKGEKPRWQWGRPKEGTRDESLTK